jgi:hypothetical protein
MKQLTGKAWRDAREELRRGAAAIERLCDKYGQDRAYGELRATIERQEKQHRRMAPAGYRHRLPVSSAVDYFVCRIVWQAPSEGATLDAIAGVRRDYLEGWSIVQYIRQRIGGYADLKALALPNTGDGPESIDYAAMAGAK